MTETFVVCTHAGRHHADELLACWFFWVLFGEEARIVRTGDPSLLTRADWLLDTGGVFDPTTGRYDHHGCAKVPLPKNPNRPPYATAGLIWRSAGYKVIESVLADLTGRPSEVYANLEPDRRGAMFSEVFGKLDK